MKERTTVQKLAENTGWLALQGVGGRLLSFALNVLIVRYLGAAGYGKLAFAMAFSGFFTILGDFGLSTYAIREVSADKETGPGCLGKGLLLNAVMSVLILAAVTAAGMAAGLEQPLLYCVVLLAMSYLLHQTGGFASAIFRAHEKMSLLFATETIYRAAQLLFCGACVFFRLDISAFAAAYLGASVLYLAVVLWLALRMIWPRLSYRLSEYLRMLRESAPYGLSAAALVVYYNADILMLSYFKGAGEVGIYSVAYNLYLALGIVASVYMGAAFPVLSRLFKNSPEGIKKAYTKSFKFLLIISVPVSFGAVMLAPGIMTALYGASFAASAAPFAVLSSVTVFFYLNAFLGHFFAAAGRVKDSFFMFCAACLLNVVLNLFLIPAYGYIGAAAATAVSETVYFTLAVIYLRRTEYHFLPWGLLVRLLAFSSVMLAALSLVPGGNVFLRVAAGAMVYLLLVLWGGILDEDDVGLVREALRR
ncbi:MAG: hypothetical protein A2049_03305 [Elusimicrobia bacterium GWA2_62_23]|nr:MAG: hypothetical protein A2049_03305 [Elusimicrobia bacterium GWA2_62_23]HBB65908.1 hypothetical protein [Elusimicrobiota bacterium]